MKTYGTLTRKGGEWMLSAEPHVILRAKRVFASTSKQHRGVLTLTDTVDTCRDLEWFVGRYPVEMDGRDRAHLETRAAEHRERETLVAQLLAGMAKPRAFDLALPPREYQRIAAEILLRNRALLLADDVGVGKTVSALAALSDAATRPALVVTMTHLTRQWQGEFARFLPGVSVHVLKKGTPYDLTLGPRAKRGQLSMPGTFPDVVITSYSKLAGWAETLAPVVKTVVYDEIQELRTGDASNKGSAAFAISDACEFRCGLSATPIYNYGSEIWNILRALKRDALGSNSEFRTEWCTWGEKLKDPKAFGTYLLESGLMLRRTREDVGRELPEVVRVPHVVSCDDEPLRRVEDAAASLASVILEKRETERGQKMHAAEELSALVRHATGVAKAPYVAEFVRLLLESGEPVVLYGWHRDVYSTWLERLAKYTPALYTGSESPAAKHESRRRFVEGETSLLIMSLRSGAGLDGLQERCRTVVFGELDWSPGVLEQNIGRVHRDGQAGSVVAYYLIADEGSDPIMADVLSIKRVQVEGVRNPHADLLEKLDTSGDRVRRLAETYLRGKVA